VYTPNGTLYPLEWCDFQLHENGENGTPPKDHSFNFKAGMTKLDANAVCAQGRPINRWHIFE
jgi:hypothetical protein